MRRARLTSLFLIALAALLVVTACQPEIPPLPNVTVVITAVSDDQALAAAVDAALTATAERNIAATETALARGNITLTPTATPTVTLTPPPPTETPFLSPTPTRTPTATPTPTLGPLPSSTPLAAAQTIAGGGGRLRVLHAMRHATINAVEVYIDDVRVAQGLEIGEDTGYVAITAPTVRVVIRAVPDVNDPPATGTELPLVSRVIDVGQGASVSVLLSNLDEVTPSLIPIRDEMAPLATGYTRLNVVQANPFLLRSNVIATGLPGALAFNMAPGDIPGPFDIPVGTYSLSLYDADSPDQLITGFSGLALNSFTSYLLVFVAAANPADVLRTTDYLVFAGSTSRPAGDVGVHFVNAAVNAGPLTIGLDDNVIVNSLGVGESTLALPVSQQGATLIADSAQRTTVFLGGLGPFTTPGDYIVVFTEAPSPGPNAGQVVASTFPIGAPASNVRASMRLIHALTGTNRSLDLEIRATSQTEIVNTFGVPQSQQTSSTYAPVVQNVRYGTGSDYVVRAPAVFDVRAVLSGTQSVQATISSLQVMAGGVYDFVAVPGDTAGVVRLILVQPDVQVAGPAINRGDPEVVREQVEVALTALAPQVSPTSTAARTATPTSSPVPTNTPRPSNTPSVPPPSIAINPAPPNAAAGSFVLMGANFRPNSRYTVSFDGGPENISGGTGEDGGFEQNITVPVNLGPGPHIVRVCVDCRIGGAQQEVLAVFVVADPARTPTPTPLP